MHALFEGRFDDAERLAQRTLEIGDRMPGLDAAGVYGVQMFTLRREQGRLAEVGPMVRHFVQTNAPVEPLASRIGPDLCRAGAAGCGSRPVRSARGRRLPHRWCAMVSGSSSIAYLAQVCSALGDVERAPKSCTRCCSRIRAAICWPAPRSRAWAPPMPCSARWRDAETVGARRAAFRRRARDERTAGRAAGAGAHPLSATRPCCWRAMGPRIGNWPPNCSQAAALTMRTGLGMRALAGRIAACRAAAAGPARPRITRRA